MKDILPESVLSELEKCFNDLEGFGSVKLEIKLHDCQARYLISIEKSIVLGKPTSGHHGVDHD